MPELNEFPWHPVIEIWKDSETEYRIDYMQAHLELLEAYETRIMERLLLVRSEIDDAEQYIKT
jgi:hypothetical protein